MNLFAHVLSPLHQELLGSAEEIKHPNFSCPDEDGDKGTLFIIHMHIHFNLNVHAYVFRAGLRHTERTLVRGAL